MGDVDVDFLPILLGALDGAFQLQGAGRQDEQALAALLAGLLEFSGELAATTDMHASDGEQHPLLEAFEELHGGSSGRTRVRLQNAPARDDIARDEVFPDYVRQRSHIGRIHLDEISGLKGLIFFGSSHRVRARTQPTKVAAPAQDPILPTPASESAAVNDRDDTTSFPTSGAREEQSLATSHGRNHVPGLRGRLLMASLGEKALENFSTFFLVGFRSRPQKCLANLRHAAAFVCSDAFQSLFKVNWHSECELCVFFHWHQIKGD
jgi:hypothetical protein